MPALLDILADATTPKFNDVNYATFLSSLGRIRDPAALKALKTSPLFYSLLSDLTAATSTLTFKPREISTILHSLAKLKSPAFPLVDKLLRTPNYAKVASPQSLANTAWSLAVLNYPDSLPFFKALNDLPPSRFAEAAKPQELSSAVWSAAKLDIPIPDLLAAIEGFGQPNAPSAALTDPLSSHPQAAANTAWAFATLGTPCPHLFAAIDKNAAWMFENGTTQTIANTAWAAGRLESPLPELFKKADEKSTWFVEEGKVSEIAGLAGAAAALKAPIPNIVADIDDCSDWFVANASAVEIANVAWALSHPQNQSKPRKTRLFHSILKASYKVVNDERAAPGTVARTVKAFTRMGIDAPQLVAAIEGRAEWCATDLFTAMNFLVACAELGRVPVKLLEVLEADWDRYTDEAEWRDLVMAAWALSILGAKENDAMLMSIWSKLLDGVGEGKWGKDPMHLKRLHQSELIARAEGVELEEMGESRRAIVLGAMDTGNNDASERGKEYIKVLRGMGYEGEEEFDALGGGERFMAVDYACVERKIAIEFDGRHHFLSDVEGDSVGERLGGENGKTKAKRRALEGLGWRVVNVPLVRTKFGALSQMERDELVTLLQ